MFFYGGKMRKVNKKFVVGIMAVLCSSIITYFCTYKHYQKAIEFEKENEELFDVIENVEENFYLDVNKEEMTYNMISGLINGLDDRYTFYSTWNVYFENQVNESITLQSSGFQIDKHKTGNILVTEVWKDSQAEKMGLKVGDVITDIDDVNVLETGYYVAIEELLGKDYTEMLLKIERDRQPFEINFVRRNIIEEKSSIKHKMLNDSTLYYNFNVFDDSTIGNFENAVEEAGESNIKNVVFDLRENIGGDTEKCVEFFDLFSDSGNEVRVVYSKSGKDIVYSTSDGIKYDFDVILLVSEKTVSCGEIFPLLFKDAGIGTIIGTQTGGKGVFQNQTILDDFTSYSIVCGYYYVNDLDNYNNIGIAPDIEVEMDSSLIGSENDIQIQKALEIFNK